MLPTDELIDMLVVNNNKIIYFSAYNDTARGKEGRDVEAAEL